MIKKLAVCAILVGLAVPGPVSAKTMLRCGRELVTTGDYQAEVYDKCGQPESIETHSEYVSQATNARIHSRNFSSGIGQQRIREIKVEEWIYNFGRRHLMHYLRFENGRLTYIESLGRGN